MSKFSLRFYRVAHCGYYKHGQPDPAIGDLDFSLKNCVNMPLGRTWKIRGLKAVVIGCRPICLTSNSMVVAGY